MKYFILILILSFTYTAFGQKQIETKYPFATDIEVDQFGNIYILEKESIFKLSSKLELLSIYRNSKLGSIASFDVSNPFKLILFSADYNQIVITDNNLNPISELIDLSNISEEITCACASINNGIWLFDATENQIVFTDDKLNVQFRSMSIESNPKSDYLVERDRKVYYFNTKDLFINDEYGNYLNQFDVFQNSLLRIDGNVVYYFLNNTISSYDLIRFIHTDLFSINYKPIDFSVKNSTLYLLKEGGTMEEYKLKDIGLKNRVN